jgi:putative oxidoreductase
MRHIPTVAGALLGLLFIAAGATFLLGMVPKMDPPPAGSLPALFMGAFAPSGYLTFVKVLELVGGLLVAIPMTRNLGLLVLGPIILNILAYHLFIMGGTTLADPMLIVIVVVTLYLLWVERKAFAGLVRRT